MVEAAYIIFLFTLGWVIEFARLDDPSLANVSRWRWIIIGALAVLWPLNWTFIAIRLAYRHARFIFSGHD